MAGLGEAGCGEEDQEDGLTQQEPDRRLRTRAARRVDVAGQQMRAQRGGQEQREAGPGYRPDAEVVDQRAAGDDQGEERGRTPEPRAAEIDRLAARRGQSDRVADRPRRRAQDRVGDRDGEQRPEAVDDEVEREEIEIKKRVERSGLTRDVFGLLTPNGNPVTSVPTE
jgi:hypothetical protein